MKTDFNQARANLFYPELFRVISLPLLQSAFPRHMGLGLVKQGEAMQVSQGTTQAL